MMNENTKLKSEIITELILLVIYDASGANNPLMKGQI